MDLHQDTAMQASFSERVPVPVTFLDACFIHIHSFL